MLLAAQARSPAPPLAPASLFEQIYCPARSALPEHVTEVLVGLSHARERYRLEHAAARRCAGTPTAAPVPVWVMRAS